MPAGQGAFFSWVVVLSSAPSRPHGRIKETIVSQNPIFHFNTEIRVRLPETDAMGIVFHGNYFTYLEVGRVDYLRNLKLSEGVRPIKDFENVVVAAHIPDAKSTVSSPPSRALILRSTARRVGLP